MATSILQNQNTIEVFVFRVDSSELIKLLEYRIFY